ncbi:hypothetical protein ACNQ13_01390 [Mycoplasma sp. VS428]|uniref:hypothetical protein n=1 Tax=Mycoplasma sp. VS428 TaxID=3401684 RepID=UPI003AAB1FD7
MYQSKIKLLRDYINNETEEVIKILTEKIDTKRATNKVVLEMFAKAGLSRKSKVWYRLKKETYRDATFLEVSVGFSSKFRIILVERFKYGVYHYDFWIIKNDSINFIHDESFCTKWQLKDINAIRVKLKNIWTHYFLANSYSMSTSQILGYLKLI